jgi:hypothetical protein
MMTLQENRGHTHQARIDIKFKSASRGKRSRELGAGSRENRDQRSEVGDQLGKNVRREG